MVILGRRTRRFRKILNLFMGFEVILKFKYRIKDTFIGVELYIIDFFLYGF